MSLRSKEKITTQFGDQLERKEDRIDVLLNFLKNIYDVDDMGDAYKMWIFEEEPENKVNL